MSEVPICIFASNETLINSGGLPLFFVSAKQGFQGEGIAATQFAYHPMSHSKPSSSKKKHYVTASIHVNRALSRGFHNC